MTNTIDYSVRLRTLADLEAYSKYIKDAIVERISHVERFTGIRLAGTRLEYNDWLHVSRYGVAHSATDKIEIGNTASALQIAGTIIHELAHMMVGHNASHNAHWSEACKALGLLTERNIYEPSDLTSDTLEIVRAAIARFAIDHPTLVYDVSSIPKPAAQTEDYLPFQVEGIQWMLRNEHNILLADEMGLGKTVEVMGYINVAHPIRILVVCPNNAKLIWKRHFETWCIHPYEVELASTQLYMFSDVVIMNYEAMVKWSISVAKQDWDLVVYDEGHYIKNPSAKRSKACYATHGAKEIIVTGTPIVNYPYELFPLIHYLDRTNWPEYGRFERNYGSRGNNKFGHNLNYLNSLLRATIMLRRFKKDVLPQLPRKRRQVVEFEVTPEVHKLIEEEMALFNDLQRDANAAEAQWLAAMKNESDVVGDDIDWAALIESLQSTKRFSFERMAEIAHKIGIAKLPYVLEHIENALESREKVIVFGHHRDVLTAIAKHFNQCSVLVLGGHADQGAITQTAADRFNNNDQCRLFVGGVTLASAYSLQQSSTVVFVEEGWVPGIYTQAEDRAHGIGRGDAEAKSMLIQHLVFEDSLDTKKAQMVIRKQRSIDKATGIKNI